MTSLVLVNGRAVDVVAVSDRAFQYGDGVYTTMMVQSGQPVLLGRHLERLCRDCSRLAIPFQDLDRLTAEIAQICDGQSDGVLKIQITRGPSGRGYVLPRSPLPTRVLSYVPCGASPNPSYQEMGVSVRICSHRLGRNSALAGVKHMNRLEQILARSEWDDEEYQEGLMLDQAGFLTEGTMSNVFLVKQAQLVTPTLKHCGVAGVMRGLVLELAMEFSIDVRCRRVRLGELLGADEVFLTNSLIRIWPVGRIENQRRSVGPLTRRFMSWVDERLILETRH